MIDKTISFLENSIAKNNNKKEIKTYKHFISLLYDIKRRDLTDKDIKALKTELAALNIEAKTEDFKSLKKKLNAFICFAKKDVNVFNF